MELDFEVVHRHGSRHQSSDAMSRLETTGKDQWTIDDEIPRIFAIPDYEATVQTQTEYLDDYSNATDPFDVPSSIIPVTDHREEPLFPEEIAMVQMTDRFCQEMALTVGNPSSKTTSTMKGSSHACHR